MEYSKLKDKKKFIKLLFHRGMQQKELSKLSKVTEATISNMLTGTGRVKTRTAYKLCKALDVDLEQYFEMEE